MNDTTASPAPFVHHPARLDAQPLSPDLYKAFLGVEREVRRSLPASLLHLVKLRSSVLNGCAFCIDMHTTEALTHGESTVRLFGVAAWHDAPWFTASERAALALTDAVTRLGPDGIDDATWREASDHFSDKEMVDLVGAIGMINLWNRLSISLRSVPASTLPAAEPVPA